jgi:hypothetical protein
MRFSSTSRPLLAMLFVAALVAATLGTPAPAIAQSTASGDASAASADAPIEVMVLGTYHFANPGQDLNNVEAGDMLAPERQAQIRALVDSLARFAPTRVAVERTPDYAGRLDSLYRAYRDGSFDLSRNEIYQIGFRLADRFDHDGVHPVDHEGDFNAQPLMQYAQQNDQALLRWYQTAFQQGYVPTVDSVIANATVPEALRWMNSAEGLGPQEAIYARMAAVGDTANYVGADLVTDWYERNLRIFTNIAQVAGPGERVLVLFGAGHAPILRRLVDAAPQMQLVEPARYL